VPDEAEQEYRKRLERLNKILTQSTDVAIGERIGLRDAVCDYVALAQARGIATDRTVQEVDAILRKAGESAAKGADTMRRRDDALASQLVYWCLAFGNARASGNVPS
jgi:hypothetical protein